MEVKGIEEIIGGKKFILAQEYLSGDYVKYNNNYGWVNNTKEMRTEANDIAQAFSHFTFEESKGSLIVVDIQGTVNKDGDLEITDPAIHTEFYSKRFGATNLGKLGIVKFFRTHECNDICKKLRLLNPKELNTEELKESKIFAGNSLILQKIYKKYEDNVTKFQTSLKEFKLDDYKVKEYIPGQNEEEKETAGLDELKEKILMSSIRESKIISELGSADDYSRSITTEPFLKTERTEVDGKAEDKK